MKTFVTSPATTPTGLGAPRFVVSRIAGEIASGERVPMTPILDAHGDPVTVEQMRRIRRRTKRANKKK